MTDIEIMNNKEEYIGILREYVKRDGVEKLISWLETTDFFEAPASTKFHGHKPGCLCKHSLNVYNNLMGEYNNYSYLKDAGCTVESIVISALVHDFCKINFYEKYYKNVKNKDTGKWESELAYRVNDQFPYGHGEKSVYLVSK